MQLIVSIWFSSKFNNWKTTAASVNIYSRQGTLLLWVLLSFWVLETICLAKVRTKYFLKTRSFFSELLFGVFCECFRLLFLLQITFSWIVSTHNAKEIKERPKLMEDVPTGNQKEQSWYSYIVLYCTWMSQHLQFKSMCMYYWRKGGNEQWAKTGRRIQADRIFRNGMWLYKVLEW